MVWRASHCQIRHFWRIWVRPGIRQQRWARVRGEGWDTNGASRPHARGAAAPYPTGLVGYDLAHAHAGGRPCWDTNRKHNAPRARARGGAANVAGVHKAILGSRARVRGGPPLAMRAPDKRAIRVPCGRLKVRTVCGVFGTYAPWAVRLLWGYRHARRRQRRAPRHSASIQC